MKNHIKTIRRQLPVFAPLAAGLVIITLLTALGGLWQYRYELDHQSSSATGAVKAVTLQKDAALVSSNTPVAAKQTTNTPTAAPGNTSAIQHKTVPAAGGNSTDGQSTTAVASISLTLSVNGQSKGTVKLPAGGNQCDVLSQALANGIINGLDMRYSSQYNTEAVYAINGQGDPGSVWWTYTVNGSAPPYGCAYEPAHNGDSVNWQYVKS